MVRLHERPLPPTFGKLKVGVEKKEKGKNFQGGVDEAKIALCGDKFRDDNVGSGSKQI